MSERDKQYTKVEREVLEILDQLETDQPKERPANVIDFRSRGPKRRFKLPSMPSLRKRPTFSIPAVTPVRMFILTAVLAISAYALRNYSSTIALLLAIASIVCLLSLFFISSGSRPGGAPRAPQTKRWRGQDIEVNPPSGGSSSSKRWPPFKRGPKL